MNEEFDYNKNYVLENDVFLLRPLEEKDFNNLLPFALNEPELWKFSLVGTEGKDGLQNSMNITLDARKDGKEYPFIVFDKRTSEYAGSTRFYDIQLAFKTLQLGYTWYGKLKCLSDFITNRHKKKNYTNGLFAN